MEDLITGSQQTSTTAYLVLDDGLVFEGRPWGAMGETYGEAVFTTGMTGYQETLTDPSYHKQVVIMTAPHIGNTGMNKFDDESKRIWVSGFVARNPSPIASSWRSNNTLDSALVRYGIVGISHVDTRAITRHLRNLGAMRVGIFSGMDLSREEMVTRVRKSPQMSGSNLVGDVSTPESYRIEGKELPGKKKLLVAAIDLGIKGATPKAMAEHGMDVVVLPSNTTIETIRELNPDGIFLSNGPGDPSTMSEMISLVRELIWDKKPIFGICFGHQIIGRALGFETYKLKFGHRGINQPVKNLISGVVEITAHNHGFAVDAPIEGIFRTAYGEGRVTHLNLNDNVVEGLEMLDTPIFSVQYHPEAAAGPHDASYLFDKFEKLMRESETSQNDSTRVGGEK